jgi:colicin import membrane protein
MSGTSLGNRPDALLPRPPGGNLPGALLALAAHAMLALALTVSVNWRSQPTTDVVAAELWASVPQVAAPPAPTAPAPAPAPPTPPPPTPAPTPKPEPKAVPPTPAPTPKPTARAEPQPKEADIATERAERRKAEADKQKREDLAEAERKKAEADKKKREDEARQAREAAAAQDKRLAEQREANLRRIMGAAATAASGRSAGAASQDASPSAAYAGRVAALIRRASVFTGSVPGNPAVEVEVRTSPSGGILARRIIKSSGHPPWDEAVLQAIDKTGTLPRDVDGRVPSQMIISFRPKEE